MTMQLNVCFGDKGKAGGDAFVVGDAVGIEAFDDIVDFVGDFDLFFLDYLIVFDDDEGGSRGDERDFIDFGGFEKAVGDFDDAFFAVFFGVEVGSEGDLVFEGIETEDADYLEDGFLGDMVNHGAIFDGIDF